MVPDPTPPDAVLPSELYNLLKALEVAARRGTVRDTADASAAVHEWVVGNGWVWG